MRDEVLTVLLSAIESRRLVVFTGAGLSMAPPSSLPSAWALAQQCAARHEEVTDERLEEAARGNVEAQARLFWSRGQLESYFLHTLVDWEPFSGGEPNAGHFAVADFLLSEVVDFTVTANVDALIERAAERLGYPTLVGAADGSEAAAPRAHRPLLKLHGCVRRNPDDTLWCGDQLTQAHWDARIENSARWLNGQLVQRDIVFIGYWTDWTYLNEVFARVLTDQKPRSVTLVDPAPPEVLAQKAPQLWEWAQRSGIAFFHVMESGSDFLQELRYRFSRILLKRVARIGSDAYAEGARCAAPDFPSTDASTVDDLYDIRRDWDGVPRNAVARRRGAQPNDQILGKVFYELIAAGAVFDGSLLHVAGKRVRLVQGAGRMLYTVKDALAADITPGNEPDVTVCAGAVDDGGAPTDILRPVRRPSVIRPGANGEWCTHAQYRTLLGIG
jgi:NAD-dependent SIR2 family protein deacetylase